MARFIVKATVSVDVEISIEAADAEAAEALIDEHLCMSASLSNVPADNYRIDGDSINDINIEDVEPEEADED